MSRKRLNYRFHNPNTKEVTARHLLKILIEAKLPKLEQAIIEHELFKRSKMMKSKSAQRQAIEYFEKKQNERKIADNMAECQMYRFAIEALQEKEERNKRGNRDSEICSQLEKLIDKYNEYIRHYESLEELDEYDQGKYDDLICNVANLKDILNSNSDAHIPTEVIDEMRELRNNFKHISLENVNAALKNLTRMEKDTLLQLYVYDDRED